MATGTTLFIRSVDGSNSFTYFLTPPKTAFSMSTASPERDTRTAGRKRSKFEIDLI